MWFDSAAETTDCLDANSGFDYEFNAIQDEKNEVYLAYKDMFDVGVNQGQDLKAIFCVYFPIFTPILVSPLRVFVLVFLIV